MNDIQIGHYQVNGKIYPSNETAAEAVRTLLRYLGEDPTRNGLEDTPRRVLSALSEMTSGRHEDPAKILERRFELVHEEMVVLKGIDFVSLCEHHLLPFVGTASVAYIPNGGRVVGLSKLARLVLCFSKRLQIQEQLTSQIVDALQEHLNPVGCACIIEAEHSCMACRGVKISGTKFVTSAMRGVFMQDAGARAELMSLLK